MKRVNKSISYLLFILFLSGILIAQKKQSVKTFSAKTFAIERECGWGAGAGCKAESVTFVYNKGYAVSTYIGDIGCTAAVTVQSNGKSLGFVIHRDPTPHFVQQFGDECVEEHSNAEKNRVETNFSKILFDIYRLGEGIAFTDFKVGTKRFSESGKYTVLATLRAAIDSTTKTVDTGKIIPSSSKKAISSDYLSQISKTEARGLKFDTLAVVEDYALLGWYTKHTGGQAILRFTPSVGKWLLVESSGGVLDDVDSLVDLGVPRTIAARLVDPTSTATVSVTTPTVIATPTRSDSCTFCGEWRYKEPYSDQHDYLKITKEGNRYKFVTGFEHENKIIWQDGNVMLRDGNDIYLDLVAGKLTGRFVSENFRPTHGHAFNYRINCSLRKDGRMDYWVWVEGELEKHIATRLE